MNDEQIAYFIRESNAIEEYHFTEEEVLKAWKNKKSNIPEIDGHVNAFNEMMYWMMDKNFKKIKPEHISKLHQTLMKDLLEPYHFGFRREWVRVGTRLCPPPIEVSPLLKKWCKKVNALKNPTEEDIWFTHLAFEYIHPFIDGNGRTGRLLWLWLRFKHGHGYDCIENVTKHRNYYPWFDHFSWDNWVNEK